MLISDRFSKLSRQPLQTRSGRSQRTAHLVPLRRRERSHRTIPHPPAGPTGYRGDRGDILCRDLLVVPAGEADLNRGLVGRRIGRLLVTGGVGPWLPFQMLGASWVAMGAGLLPRDPRKKESKKYGLKKARKAPQYSKR